METFNPFKTLFALIGCLVVFSTPILGILIIWGFDTESMSQSFENFINSNETSNIDYNFNIPAGEDALLTSHIKSEVAKTEITPQSNPAKLVKIDSAQIEGPVVYGQDSKELLKQGFWHYPGSAYPGEQGVGVIFGHRRHNLPPAKDTFFNLDKVNIGDRIEILLQNGTWLEYTVINIEVINPEDLFLTVTEQSDDFLIKFITCTPLGTDKQRLVVTAKKTF